MVRDKSTMYLLIVVLMTFVKTEKLKVKDEHGNEYEMAYEAPDIFKPIPHS